MPPRFRLQGALVIGLAAILLASVNGAARAEGEIPHDYALTPTINTHFYTIGVTRVETGVGAPYVTTKGSTTVLSMDWDGELASTDVNSKTVTHLGRLGLPARSRVLDFQYFGEWSATASAIPVFVSYAFLDEATQCRHLVLRQASLDATGAGANTWGRVWFTSPCYPMVPAEDSYFLTQSGGRMALVPKSERANPKQAEFMLGVGDFKIMVTPPKMSAPARNTLGTIVHITRPGKYEVFARGLRNVQGLMYGTLDGRPAVIATSQGPRGGDELVHATKGADFGWPRYNYGTGYYAGDKVSTPKHEGTGGPRDLPMFAWLPSVGLSAGIQVKGPSFSKWWNGTSEMDTPDLILAGMGARWLYRVRYERGAVRYFAGILLGARARSLAQLPDGRIVVGLDAGSEFVVLAPTEDWSAGVGGKVPHEASVAEG